MADIRINALATTAASTASDDYIAIDGSANGTRKLNAYSPTFGGNLTVNGTANLTGIVTTNSSTGFTTFGGRVVISDSSGIRGTSSTIGLFSASGVAYFGNYDSATGLKITLSTGAAEFTNNLTVSGTGTSSGNILTANTSLYTTDASLSNYSATNGVYINGNAAGWLQIAGDGTRSTTIRLNGGASGAIEFNTSGSSRATLAANGNLLLGTTTDNTAKLQVYATPATAGYQYGIRLSDNSTTTIALGLQNVAGSSMPFVYGNSALGFGTNGVTALTLDSSQNATFAGTIKPQQAATASAPTYVKGAIYFDTTLNKLRVGGAIGWETITSV